MVSPVAPPPLVRGVPLDEIRRRFDRAMKHVPPGKQEQIMREAAKNVHERFWDIRLPKKLEALGFESPAPKERWQFFVRVMAPEMWAELEMKYPSRYENLRRDFERLMERALAGDFEEEMV